MNRLLIAVCVVVLTACGSGSGVGGPPSAQSVAQNDSDFPGMHRCQQSGSYDSYLKTEQTRDPTQYQSDKKMWDEIKAAGANDSYIAIYVQSAADCNKPSLNSLSGKAAYVFAIRYKDTASAAASFTSELAPFHLSADDISQITALGGTAKRGSTTGLGDNSVLVTFSAAGVSLYIALWQSKEFLVLVLAEGVPAATESAAAKNVNGRIR